MEYPAEAKRFSVHVEGMETMQGTAEEILTTHSFLSCPEGWEWANLTSPRDWERQLLRGYLASGRASRRRGFNMVWKLRRAG